MGPPNPRVQPEGSKIQPLNCRHETVNTTLDALDPKPCSRLNTSSIYIFVFEPFCTMSVNLPTGVFFQIWVNRHQRFFFSPVSVNRPPVLLWFGVQTGPRV